MNEEYMDHKTTTKGTDFNNKEINPQDWSCVAKTSKTEPSNLERYFVRVCTDGPDNGFLYNPMVHPQSDLKRFDAFKGRKRFDFKSVSKECYDMYIEFLKNKNPSLLRNAERMTINV